LIFRDSHPIIRAMRSDVIQDASRPTQSAASAQVARQLLHDTRSPVSRIAASLGFGDATVFTRAFRGTKSLVPEPWTGLPALGGAGTALPGCRRSRRTRKP
jgi:transcriptional regulator GlxA family with amidase domain